MGFEVGPCLVCRVFCVLAFDVFCRDASFGDYYFPIDNYLGVCLSGALGFGNCGVFTDGVEYIDDGIAIYVDVVDCLMEGFIKALVGYFAIGAEYIFYVIFL